MNNFIIPTSGLIFLFAVFVYFYLSIKFYRCFKEENNRIAKFFSYSFFLIGLNYIVMAVPSLFLIENRSIWRVASPLYVFFMAAGWIVLAYAVFSEKYPKRSQIAAVLFSFICLLSVLPFVFYAPNYFFTDGVLNWNFEITNKNILLFFIPFAVTPVFIFIPLAVIFFLKAKNTDDKKLRMRSLGFALSMSFVMIGMAVDVVLLNILNVHPVYSDLNYLIMLTILAVTLIFTWFPAKSKYVSKID